MRPSEAPSTPGAQSRDAGRVGPPRPQAAFRGHRQDFCPTLLHPGSPHITLCTDVSPEKNKRRTEPSRTVSSLFPGPVSDQDTDEATA